MAKLPMTNPIARGYTNTFRKWARVKDAAGEIEFWPNADAYKYTRFKTNTMSEMLPNSEMPDSGWKTNNHYFYELVNDGAEKFYIKLVFSLKNSTDRQRSIFEKIDSIFHKEPMNLTREYRNVFKTDSVRFSEVSNEEEIFHELDKMLDIVKDTELKINKIYSDFM